MTWLPMLKHATLVSSATPPRGRDRRRSRHRSRSRSHGRRTRRRRSPSSSSDDEMGGYVPRKRQEPPRPGAGWNLWVGLSWVMPGTSRDKYWAAVYPASARSRRAQVCTGTVHVYLRVPKEVGVLQAMASCRVVGYSLDLP